MPSQDSKQNFALLRNKILAEGGKEYWRSVEEFVDAPEFEEFVKREYPDHAEHWDDSLSRRNFIKVMGASLALAGLSGCVIQPPEKIVPYVTAPTDSLPGKPLFFATSYSIGGVAMGLLAKSYEGRPIKIEGNPEHPNSRGATDVRAQASLLDMYDPDRTQQVTFRGVAKTWPAFSTELRSAIDADRQNGGAGIRFLSETITSPTIVNQFKQLATELPGAKWIQYEPINSDNAMAGAKMAFGAPAQAVYHFDKAERILTLDADIFSGFNVGYLKDYAAGKNWSPDKKDINRLYMVETTASITGAKADHRLAVKPSQLVDVAKAIAQRVGVAGANSAYNANTQWLDAMSRDLVAFKGRSVVVAGDSAPPVVHALAHAMNGALGNIGQTVDFIEPLAPNSDKLQINQLRELMSDIDAGRVKVLVILGGNPAYNTPADLRLSLDRINEKVPLRVYVGQHDNETAEICHWNIPEKHYLESWGDSRSYDGTVTLTQPLIAPLYDSHNISEVVQLFFKENFEKADLDIVKGFWQTQTVPAAKTAAATTGGTTAANIATASATTANSTTAPQAVANSNSTPPTSTNPATATTQASRASQANSASTTPAATSATAAAAFEDRWRKYVHDGLIPNTFSATKAVTVSTAFLSQPLPPAPSGGAFEINVRPDPNTYDGRFANNGWMQELPKPLNKVTWDNVALVSPATAAKLGVNQGREYDVEAGGEQGTAFITTKGSNQFSDLVTLTYGGNQVAKGVPMWVTPGQPDDVITIFLGYGRKRGGRIATNVGYNVYDVRRADTLDWATGDLKKTGETTTISSTQLHFNMEGRDLLRSWDLASYNENPKMGAQENVYDLSMYPYQQHEATYENNNRWGMSVDLNNCVGCNACVLACQSENNIPVVGREQVDRHRMMHWLRIDAYFGGADINNPEGPHFQPVLCQQCEQAPCEVVCPVHATVHSAEGLNDMVYNRCVGTRYCSNNCPYKVRRFNFLLYQDWDTPQYKLMRNPEVSIRSRGVMEKCTYCTQRIAAARIEAEKDGSRPIRDGEVVTACQAACPTNVFSFGDLHDENSVVAKKKRDPRNYTLLNDLNTQPRTTYLAELKNQNKEMPDYKPNHFPDVHYEESESSEHESAPTEH
jgi:molybdopterin-containing oxidoreductase family iron-sulfur binding subunit